MDSLCLHDQEAIENTPSSATPIVNCDGPGGLSAIRDGDTELVVWRRTLAHDFREWITTVDPGCLPKLRILIAPNDLSDALGPLLDQGGLAIGPMPNLLINDIENLVQIFSEITESDLVDVRLEAVNTDACWKFHRDNVEARLLTTYLGLATEWVPMDHAEQAITEQKDYAGPIERLGLGDVALFKGSANDPDRGIVHRSPPILGTGQTRLLLVLNQPTISSPEPWSAA